MKKLFYWFNLPHERKIKSLINHIYYFVFKIINTKYPKIIKNIHFNNYPGFFKYTETKYEKFLLFSNDGGISRQIFINGEYNLKTLKKAIKIIGKLELIIDVGANIGSTCIASLKRNYASKGIAIEADINNFQMLKRNIELNNLEKKLLPLNYIVSNKSENYKIIKNKNNYGANFVKKISAVGKKKNKVRSIKLDNLKINLPKKTLVWIDVQGFEPYVLKGSTNIINRKIPFVIEFWPKALKRSNGKSNLIQCMKKFKYFYDLYDTNDKKLINNQNIEKLFKVYSKKNTEILLTNF